MKRVILLLMAMFPLNGALAAQGQEGHGASDIAGALHKVKSETIPRILKTLEVVEVEFRNDPRLAREYRGILSRMKTDVSEFQLKKTQESLKDVSSGYSTWISLDIDRKKIIHYNPTEYKNSKAAKSDAPISSIATEHLLHEIGHYYELNEDEAWTFAQNLLTAFQRATLEGKPEAMPAYLGNAGLPQKDRDSIEAALKEFARRTDIRVDLSGTDDLVTRQESLRKCYERLELLSVSYLSRNVVAYSDKHYQGKRNITVHGCSGKFPIKYYKAEALEFPAVIRACNVVCNSVTLLNGINKVSCLAHPIAEQVGNVQRSIRTIDEGWGAAGCDPR